MLLCGDPPTAATSHPQSAAKRGHMPLSRVVKSRKPLFWGPRSTTEAPDCRTAELCWAAGGQHPHARQPPGDVSPATAPPLSSQPSRAPDLTPLLSPEGPAQRGHPHASEFLPPSPLTPLTMQPAAGDTRWAHSGGFLQVGRVDACASGHHWRRGAELCATGPLAQTRIPHPEPEQQEIHHRTFLRGFTNPQRSRSGYEALESLFQGLGQSTWQARPGWPHRKWGHGRDTNGNLWGRPLCSWRSTCRTERQPPRESGELRLRTAGRPSISCQRRRVWGSARTPEAAPSKP